MNAALPVDTVPFRFVSQEGNVTSRCNVNCIARQTHGISDALTTVMLIDGRTGRVTEAPQLETRRINAAVATSEQELFFCSS